MFRIVLGRRDDGLLARIAGEMVLTHESLCDRPADQSAEDQTKSGAGEAEIDRSRERAVLTHESAPGNRGTVPARE